MKAILDFVPVILFILFIGFLAFVGIYSSMLDGEKRSLESLDKKAHTQFMVDNKCIISIIDETLLRKGCIDINNEIHWRE